MNEPQQPACSFCGVTAAEAVLINLGGVWRCQAHHQARVPLSPLQAAPVDAVSHWTTELANLEAANVSPTLEDLVKLLYSLARAIRIDRGLGAPRDPWPYFVAVDSAGNVHGAVLPTPGAGSLGGPQAPPPPGPRSPT